MSLFGLNSKEIFEFINFTAFPAWILLLIAPKHKLTNTFVKITAFILSFDYLIFFLMTLSGTTSINSYQDILLLFKATMDTLKGFANNFSEPKATEIAKAFASDTGFLTGWVHFLAVDLLLGFQISQDAEDVGFSKIISIPLLVVTFLFPPVGFILFTCLKLLHFLFRREEKLE
jgi:hypothetical protein